MRGESASKRNSFHPSAPYPRFSSIVQFILKGQARPTITELLIAIAVTLGVYVGLFLLEGVGKFLLLTPPKIHDEQIEVIQDLHGQISVFQDQPGVSATEQRRRDQVREQWRSLTPDESVVQFIHDKEDTDAMTFNGSGLDGDALRSAIPKTVRCGLILHHREEGPVVNPML